MITSYYRPESLSEALERLSQQDPPAVPLGGGTVLSRQRKPDIAVVDLQRLGLDKIEQQGQALSAGATVRLQQLLEYLYEAKDLPERLRGALIKSLELEATRNLRQVATLAGTVVSCGGRSPFITALLALDPKLEWAGGEEVPLGDYLPLREAFAHLKLMVGVRFSINASLQFEMVARTPADQPIVCAAVARWPSGRTRVTLGGYGKAPVLAMDGPEPGGAAVAAREAYRNAGDEWASAEYRREIAGKLVQRMLQESAAGGEIL